MSEVTSTDLYEVTMALSYLREGMQAQATSGLFVRDLPPVRGFLVAAGLEPALDYLSRFRAGPADVRDFAAALHRPPGNRPASWTSASGTGAGHTRRAAPPHPHHLSRSRRGVGSRNAPRPDRPRTRLDSGRTPLRRGGPGPLACSHPQGSGQPFADAG